jgi:hypothetical protein
MGIQWSGGELLSATGCKIAPWWLGSRRWPTDALGFTRHPGSSLSAAGQVMTRTSPVTPHLDSIAHGAAHTDASCRRTQTASCWWRVSVVLATKRRRQQIAL